MISNTELTIEAGRAERHYWADLWRYRELFYFLAWRDILVRYKQTVLGVAWAVLRPFLTTVVFTVVFQRIAKLPSPDAPYPIMVLAGMLPWQLFATSVAEAGNSLVGNANLISKIYFPRVIVPASSLMTSIVDFLVSAVMLVGVMAWYGFVPSWRVIAVVPFILLTVALAFGCGLWVSALTVRYRDFRYVVPFVVQFGLYISPVGFTSAVVPERWRVLYGANPMAGLIDGFRWALLGGGTAVHASALALSVIAVAVSVATGIWYFRATERTFADVI